MAAPPPRQTPSPRRAAPAPAACPSPCPSCPHQVNTENKMLSKLSPTSISFEDRSKYLQTLINVDSSRMPPGAGPILTEGSFEQNI